MATIEVYRHAVTGAPMSAAEGEEARMVEVHAYASGVDDGQVEEIGLETHGEMLTEEEMDRAYEAAQAEWDESDEGREWRRSERRSEEQYRQGSYWW